MYSDREMNDVYFEDPGIPQPDVITAAGGAIRAKYPVVRVEAGLRSGDMSMPVEINRLVTDSIIDGSCATEPSGVAQPWRAGTAEAAIHQVSDAMADNALHPAGKLIDSDMPPPESLPFNRERAQDRQRYGVVTLHRLSNVDSLEMMTRISRPLCLSGSALLAGQGGKAFTEPLISDWKPPKTSCTFGFQPCQLRPLQPLSCPCSRISTVMVASPLKWRQQLQGAW